jgi:hypothetical protein
MEFLDQAGLGQAQDVVVALEVVRMAAETLAAEIGFRELAGLHHRAFGPSMIAMRCSNRRRSSA